jgi:hypothetical protein
MQQTTNIMFAHYMARGLALDVIWMRRRRAHILYGDLNLAMIKTYHIYSGAPYEMMVERQQDYPSPLFDKVRKTHE